jgi:hypothetical protein
MTTDPEEQDARRIADLVDAMLADSTRAGQAGPTGAEPATPPADTDAALSSQAARELRIADSLRSDGPAPSLALLSSIEREVRGARAQGDRPRQRRTWRLRPAVAVAAAGLAVALAAVVIISSGSNSPGAGRSLNQAAALAFRPSAAPAPGTASPTLLAVSYHGVTFPNYEHRFGSNPTGQRTDAIGGQHVLTIFYRLHDGTRLSYSVFAGTPVSLPAGAATTQFKGVSLHSYRTGSGLSVVTLVRHGRTCVLAAHGASVGQLLALAEWPLTVSHA